ncbi:hypothetical protein M0R45_017917 [Rubus argutus]|uniref:Uncharacterized protein n=1 Tax=Rubus argutus TaxID=59490 RepID=A0AAW1XZF9_RUBAR
MPSPKSPPSQTHQLASPCLPISSHRHHQSPQQITIFIHKKSCSLHWKATTTHHTSSLPLNTNFTIVIHHELQPPHLWLALTVSIHPSPQTFQPNLQIHKHQSTHHDLCPFSTLPQTIFTINLQSQTAALPPCVAVSPSSKHRAAVSLPLPAPAKKKKTEEERKTQPKRRRICREHHQTTTPAPAAPRPHRRRAQPAMNSARAVVASSALPPSIQTAHDAHARHRTQAATPCHTSPPPARRR